MISFQILGFVWSFFIGVYVIFYIVFFLLLFLSLSSELVRKVQEVRLFGIIVCICCIVFFGVLFEVGSFSCYLVQRLEQVFQVWKMLFLEFRGIGFFFLEGVRCSDSFFILEGLLVCFLFSGFKFFVDVVVCIFVRFFFRFLERRVLSRFLACWIFICQFQQYMLRLE